MITRDTCCWLDPHIHVMWCELLDSRYSKCQYNCPWQKVFYLHPLLLYFGYILLVAIPLAPFHFRTIQVNICKLNAPMTIIRS
jgi:hypothetical protein